MAHVAMNLNDEKLHVLIKVRGTRYTVYINDIYFTQLDDANHPYGGIATYLCCDVNQGWMDLSVTEPGANNANTCIPSDPTKCDYVTFYSECDFKGER
jgi:hypothetical protein